MMTPEMSRILQMLGRDRSALGQLAGAAQPQKQGFFQTPGVRDAMMAMGLGLLAQKDQPGSLGGAIGRAGPGAVSAFEQGQQNAALEGAAAGLPQNMQRILGAIQDPTQRAMLTMQMLSPRGPMVVGEGDRIVDPNTLEVLLDSVPDNASPTKVQEYEYAVAQGYEGTYTDFVNETRSPGVTINTGDRAASAASGVIGQSAAQSLVSSAETAGSALNKIETTRQMQELLSQPEARRVFGPGASIRALAERFSNDPTARQILAQYQALAGQNVLAGLDAFTGAISDKEREYIEKISQADPSMTVEELRAGLQAIDRIQRANAERFLGELESFDPAAFGVTPEQMGRFRALADRVRPVLRSDLYNKYGITPTR